jgi:hypothetical protein
VARPAVASAQRSHNGRAPTERGMLGAAAARSRGRAALVALDERDEHTQALVAGEAVLGAGRERWAGGSLRAAGSCYAALRTALW